MLGNKPGERAELPYRLDNHPHKGLTGIIVRDKLALVVTPEDDRHLLVQEF